MYILMDEFGELYYTKNLTDEMKGWCGNGIMTIIDPKQRKEYSHDEQWVDIPKWGE